jgi:hypothetical protein
VSFATDANLLLYAVHRESEFHLSAKTFIEGCMAEKELWALPWPVVHAFLRISTHTAVFPNPLSPAQAVSVIDDLARLPHVQFIGERPEFWNGYRTLMLARQTRGNSVSDALIAALLAENGVTTLYTKDRDFLRFEGIKVIDPF